jgi:hypothetical protein
MRVTITRDDLKRGQSRDAQHCPMAMAISRELGFPVEVWSHMVVAILPAGRVWMALPPDAQRWIVRWDRGQLRRPTSPGFVFELPDNLWQAVYDTGWDSRERWDELTRETTAGGAGTPVAAGPAKVR